MQYRESLLPVVLSDERDSQLRLGGGLSVNTGIRSTCEWRRSRYTVCEARRFRKNKV